MRLCERNLPEQAGLIAVVPVWISLVNNHRSVGCVPIMGSLRDMWHEIRPGNPAIAIITIMPVAVRTMAICIIMTAIIVIVPPLMFVVMAVVVFVVMAVVVFVVMAVVVFVVMTAPVAGLSRNADKH